MENTTEELLDWLADLDLSHYKTESFPDYNPSGNSHFYLKGSQERFTSKEIIDIFNNRACDTVNKNWQYAIAENIRWHLRQK
jgi:hypothetical protein